MNNIEKIIVEVIEGILDRLEIFGEVILYVGTIYLLIIILRLCF